VKEKNKVNIISELLGQVLENALLLFSISIFFCFSKIKLILISF
jgi:hypothetical protein